MTMKKSPNISVITNIYEDHLDYHRDFKEYVLAKTNIFDSQKENDICILNYDSDFTKDFDSFIRKALLYEEYDKVWKLIKEKNNW